MIQKVEFGDIIFMSGNKFNLQFFEPNEINVEYQTASYIDQDGQDVLSGVYEPRYVMLQGHILAKSESEYYYLRRKLISVCDGKAERDLTYFAGDGYYKAKAIASVPIFDVRKGYCLPFSIKFAIPSFFWTDIHETTEDIVQFIPLLNSFNFDPFFMFSMTTTQAYIYNHSLPTPFKIIITGQGGEEHEEYGIKILNETTGEFIHVIKDVVNGEIITIDTENATITSSIDGNIITYVSDDSKPDMMLASGSNLISAENFNINNSIAVKLIYRNRYAGV